MPFNGASQLEVMIWTILVEELKNPMLHTWLMDATFQINWVAPVTQ